MEINPEIPAPSGISELLEEFKKGAKLLHLGIFLEDEAVQQAGYKRYHTIIQKLDALGPNGRDFLLPLIDHEDDDIKVISCAFLMRDYMELVKPIMEYIQDNNETEAYICASNTLASLRLNKGVPPW